MYVPNEVLIKLSKAYEQKLIELMGQKAFEKFSIQIAKDLFFESVNDIKDSDLRNFCLDNFENITNVSDCSKLDFPNSKEGDNMD